jgi:hypothetical protein
VLEHRFAESGALDLLVGAVLRDALPRRVALRHPGDVRPAGGAHPVVGDHHPVVVEADREDPAAGVDLHPLVAEHEREDEHPLVLEDAADLAGRGVPAVQVDGSAVGERGHQGRSSPSPGRPAGDGRRRDGRRCRRSPRPGGVRRGGGVPGRRRRRRGTRGHRRERRELDAVDQLATLVTERGPVMLERVQQPAAFPLEAPEHEDENAERRQGDQPVKQTGGVVVHAIRVSRIVTE